MPPPIPYDPRVTPAAVHHRPAFGDVNRHDRHVQLPSEHAAMPLRTSEKAKELETPRLTRQNTKTTPPSPPLIIRGRGGIILQRDGFLGEVRVPIQVMNLSVYIEIGWLRTSL